MFLGTKEILSHNETDGYVFVKFADGTEDKYSKVQFDQLISEESLNDSDYRLKRCLFLEDEIYKTLLLHNVHVSDIDFICSRLPNSVKENYLKAINLLWGKGETSQKTMWEMHEILARLPKED